MKSLERDGVMPSKERSMELPMGPITRARAKELRNALSNFVADLVNKQGNELQEMKPPRPISLCQIEGG